MASPKLLLLNTAVEDELHEKNDITLKANPKTDIFASPTIGYHFSAPLAFKSLPTKRFHKARATITIPFTLNASRDFHIGNPTLQFDQAGLVFVLPDPKFPNPHLANPGSDNPTNPHPKWVKMGVEVWEGKALGSVVVREQWSDWSVFAVSGTLDTQEVSVTMEMEKLGDALMIYKINDDGRELVRKVPWCFLDGHTQDTVWIGVYGARPDPYGEAGGRTLTARFKNLEIEEEEYSSGT